MEKLRVLQVGLSYKGGGIETFLINYTSNIDKEKVSIDFLNTFESSKQENFYKKLEKNDIIKVKH